MAKLKSSEVPKMPKGTAINVNGSYDAIVDGFDCRWRFFDNGEVAVFIRYNPNRHKTDKKGRTLEHPWEDCFVHPEYDK